MKFIMEFDIAGKHRSFWVCAIMSTRVVCCDIYLIVFFLNLISIETNYERLDYSSIKTFTEVVLSYNNTPENKTISFCKYIGVKNSINIKY